MAERIWNCIIITCSTLSSVISTEKEINLLKKKGRIRHSNNILVIEDPAKNVGSGAATLNALLIATEYLSAQKNYMVITADVLQETRILILHNGRDYLHSCSNKAFISLPIEYEPRKSNIGSHASGIVSNLESILLLIDGLSSNSPFGIWVCSTDMTVLSENKNDKDVHLDNTDVAMFCIPCDLQYATSHGVVAIDEQGYIGNILYCGSIDDIQQCASPSGKVPLVSGIVFLSAKVAESLLSLHVQAPLDSCTYLGLDSGVEPIQVSLFFDILIAMSTKLTKNAFVSGKCGKTYNIKAGFKNQHFKESIQARSLVWDELSRYRMTPVVLSGCRHIYWPSYCTAQMHINNLFDITHCGKIHSICQESAEPFPDKHLIINSTVKTHKCSIKSSAVISDSVIEVNMLNVEQNTYILGVSYQDSTSDLRIPARIAIVNYFLKEPKEAQVIVVFGVEENLTLAVNFGSDTFCNKSWLHIFETLQVGPGDIWGSDLKPEERTLMNGKLFPSNFSVKEMLHLFHSDPVPLDIIQKWKSMTRFSLLDVMKFCDYRKFFDYKRHVYAQITLEKIKNILCKNEDIPVLPFFYTAYAEGWSDMVIEMLDSILFSHQNSIVLTRTLSCMADLLGTMAGTFGGLRSGPGCNKSWFNAFNLLLSGNINEGMIALSEERSNWLGRPDHLMRAARHYERAAQILIQNSVKTVKEYVTLNTAPLPEVGSYVTAECPARIDLQGGWSDTPPICYEMGGSVVNIAVLLDGKKPVGAKACRIKEPHIVIKLGLDEMCSEILVDDLKDVLNYDQPNAKGALLKASLICSGIVDINSNLSLSQQLMTNFNGGFEVQSWSLLPQGCGMGTSSILAGAVISVLWSVSGKSFDKMSIVHAVLFVEQLLTTGGGWQDQLSGIMGGVNRGYSEPQLPLHIKVDPIPVPPEMAEKLNNHLLLIYTGKVRLAKNLLQNVVRNWYAQEEIVVRCFKNLISHSIEMKEAIIDGNLERIGELMDDYWVQKKILAPGCEPASVKEIMKCLKPVCHGQLLVGAGGGGYMCILTKRPKAQPEITNILSNVSETQKLSVHIINIHSSGLELTHS